MSILPQAVKLALIRLRRLRPAALLPASCVLCGADGAAPVLCPGCAADLPLLPAARCPQCAEPTTHGERCGRCLAVPPHFDATTAIFRYDFPLDRLVHALKYGHQLGIAAWLGDCLAGAATDSPGEVVVPLPLHPARLRSRGFNQSAEIARSLAARLGRPVAYDLLQRRRDTGPQAALPLKERAANVRRAFECSRDAAGASFLLVDDVMTSGATLDEAARTLKLHGARTVGVAVVARALRN